MKNIDDRRINKLIWSTIEEDEIYISNMASYWHDPPVGPKRERGKKLRVIGTHTQFIYINLHEATWRAPYIVTRKKPEENGLLYETSMETFLLKLLNGYVCTYCVLYDDEWHLFRVWSEFFLIFPRQLSFVCLEAKQKSKLHSNQSVEIIHTCSINAQWESKVKRGGLFV